jgi:hypothetical protein
VNTSYFAENCWNNGKWKATGLLGDRNQLKGGRVVFDRGGKVRLSGEGEMKIGGKAIRNWNIYHTERALVVKALGKNYNHITSVWRSQVTV